MKKLLLVGVVGMSALLAGCGGGDCEEGTVLPPVTEVAFPKGQAPEYVIRFDSPNERMVSLNYSGQVLSLNTDKWEPVFTVQKFDATYEGGYMTKPTTDVVDVAIEEGGIVAMSYEPKHHMSRDDLEVLKDELLTVRVYDTAVDMEGNNLSRRVVIYPTVVGPVDEVLAGSIIINGQMFDSDNEAGFEEGSYAVGITADGGLKNIQLSGAGPAWGIQSTVIVKRVVGVNQFVYDTHFGEVMATLKDQDFGEDFPHQNDSEQTTANLKIGSAVLLVGNAIDFNTMTTDNVMAYLK